MKRLKNIESKNEQQLEAIKNGQKLHIMKNKRLQLADQIKDDKLRLKSLTYVINKEDKKQVQYFDILANLEDKTRIDYNKLYYRSEKRNMDVNFEEFGAIADLFQKIKFEEMDLKDVEPILVKFYHKLNLLENATTHK